MNKALKRVLKDRAKQVIEAYKKALMTGNYREYFTLFGAFADECEKNNIDPEAFLPEKKFVSLDYSFGL